MTLRQTVDGDEYRSLLATRPPQKGEIKFRRAAEGILLTDLRYIAIALWLRPEKLLRHNGWRYDSMSLDELDVDVAGVKCHRLVIPHRTKNRTATVYVDSSRGYVPIRWEQRSGKNMALAVNLDYRSNEHVGFVPSGWTEWYKDSEPTQAEVAFNSINQEIAGDRLRIVFPMGTLVTKANGRVRTYAIQKDDGLQTVDEAEFDKEMKRPRVAASGTL